MRITKTYNAFAALMLLSIPQILIASPSPEAFKLSGDHYVFARSQQQTTGEIKLANTSRDVIKNVTVSLESSSININNGCRAGVLPGQSCVITYSYRAGDDVGSLRNAVTSKLQNADINFQIGSQNIHESFFIVSSQIDSLRLLTLPVSKSNHHQIPDRQINDLVYDDGQKVIYAVSQLGLAMSFDAGSNWQTLTPYNSTLNIPGQKNSENVVPKMVHVSNNNLYVALFSKDDYKTYLMLSQDHGASWSILKAFSGTIYDVAENGSDIYVAAYNLQVSHDAGRTWKTTIEKNTVYSVDANQTGVYVGTTNGLLKSNNGEAPFVPVLSSADQLCAQHEICSVTRLKLVDDKIYALLRTDYIGNTKLIKGDAQGFKVLTTLDGTDKCDFTLLDNTIMAGCYGSGVYLSNDAGRTWDIHKPAEVTVGYGDYGRVILMPGAVNPQLMLLSFFGYPTLSTDFGKSWHDILPDPYAGLSLEAIYANPEGDHLLQYTGGTVSISKDSGLSWHDVPSPKQYISPIKPFNYKNKFYYVAGAFHDDGKAYLYQSDPELNTWTPIELKFENGPKSYYLGYKTDENGVIYAAYNITSDLSNSVITSDDDGKTWRSFGPETPIKKDYSTCRMSVVPGRQLLLIGDCYAYQKASTEIFIQTDKVKNVWKQMSFNDYFSGASTEGDSIYFLMIPDCFSCNRPASLHISHDGGSSWVVRDIKLGSTYQPQPRLLSVRNGTIYLSNPSELRGFDAYSKLSISHDDGLSWKDMGTLVTAENTGSDDHSLVNLAFSDNSIYLATRAGLFEIGVDKSQV